MVDFEDKILNQKGVYIINDKTLSKKINDEYHSLQPFCLTKDKIIINPSNKKKVNNISKGYLLKNGYKLDCYIFTTKNEEYVIMKNDDYQFVRKYDYHGILIYE